MASLGVPAARSTPEGRSAKPNIKPANANISEEDAGRGANVKDEAQKRALKRESRRLQNLKNKKSSKDTALKQTNADTRQRGRKHQTKKTLTQNTGKFMLTGAICLQLGLRESDLLSLAERMKIDVKNGAKGQYFSEADVLKLQDKVESRGRPIRLSTVALLHRRDHEFVRECARRLRLNTQQGNSGHAAVLFEDYRLLVAEITERNESLYRRRLEAAGMHWAADGTPLSRFEKSQISTEPRKNAETYVQVVSGGLPTLGKGRW